MKALITGVSGQVGSYLAEFLLNKGYDVVGMRRRTATGSIWRLANCINNKHFTLVEGDVTDFSSCLSLIQTYKPDEVYNLAAQSHVGTSFNQPTYTWDATARGPLNLLECIRLTNSSAKFYQASSSEMFGTNFNHSQEEHTIGFQASYTELNFPWRKKWQDETTSFRPQSPYAIAKLAAHNLVKLYREAYGMYAVGGLLFNNESPRRGINFVTRKITSYLHNLVITTDNNGNHYNKLKLGNLDSMRDWGFSKEYCEPIWLMLQQTTPKDYVIGTGETHSVKEFLIETFKLFSKTKSIVELPVDMLVDIDENCKRPAEVPYLRADASLAEKELGWKAKTKFYDLIKIMVEEENGLP